MQFYSVTWKYRKLNNLTCSLAFLDFKLPVIIILSGVSKDKIIPGGSRTDMAMADLIFPRPPQGNPLPSYAVNTRIAACIDGQASHNMKRLGMHRKMSISPARLTARVGECAASPKPSCH